MRPERLGPANITRSVMTTISNRSRGTTRSAQQITRGTGESYAAARSIGRSRLRRVRGRGGERLGGVVKLEVVDRQAAAELPTVRHMRFGRFTGLAVAERADAEH